MEKQKKVSLFTRMYSAITDFRIYPFVQREKLSTAILYFLKLIALIVLVITSCMIYKTYTVIEKIATDYTDAFPEFTFKNGELSAENRVEYSYGNGIIILDTNYTQLELKEAVKRKIIGYDFYTLISKDSFNMYIDEFVRINVSSDEFIKVNVYVEDELIYGANYPILFETFNKTTFFENVINPFNETKFKISFFIEFYIASLFIYIMFKGFDIIAAMITVIIFNLIFGNNLKLKDVLKIVMYALTLPLIIESIAFLLTGTVSESVIFIYQLLVYVYVFYALRAIKLDKIIIAATQSGILKKIVNGEDIDLGKLEEIDIDQESKNKDEEKDKED